MLLGLGDFVIVVVRVTEKGMIHFVRVRVETFRRYYENNVFQVGSKEDRRKKCR